MTETYKTNGNNGWWIGTTSNTTGTISIPKGTYIYSDGDKSSWFGGIYSTKPDSESADEVFNRKRMIRTKDQELIELTYAEIYELKRLKKVPEEMTKDEITDVLLVLRI